MDDLKKEIWKAEVIRDQLFGYIEQLLPEIERIVERGPDGSEEDQKLMLICTEIVKMEFYRRQLDINIGGIDNV